MAFRSEAHRRWWFANRESGGSGSLRSLSSGAGSAFDHSGNAAREAAFQASPSTTRHASKEEHMRTVDLAADEAFEAQYRAMWAEQADPAQQRRDARIAYASAMYPELSEPDALRKLNDREGFDGLPKS